MPDKNTQTLRSDKTKVSCFLCKGVGLVKIDMIPCSCTYEKVAGCYKCNGRGFKKAGYDTCERCHGCGYFTINDP